MRNNHAATVQSIFYAGAKLLHISDLKDMPVFRAKQIVKTHFSKQTEANTVKLFAYGFEKRIAYKLSSSTQKWEVLKDE